MDRKITQKYLEIQRKQGTFPGNVLELEIPEEDWEIPRKRLDRIPRKQREILGNHKYLERFWRAKIYLKSPES